MQDASRARRCLGKATLRRQEQSRGRPQGSTQNASQRHNPMRRNVRASSVRSTSKFSVVRSRWRSPRPNTRQPSRLRHGDTPGVDSGRLQPVRLSTGARQSLAQRSPHSGGSRRGPDWDGCLPLRMLLAREQSACSPARVSNSSTWAKSHIVAHVGSGIRIATRSEEFMG
jgi:hypothetical protein